MIESVMNTWSRMPVPFQAFWAVYIVIGFAAAIFTVNRLQPGKESTDSRVDRLEQHLEATLAEVLQAVRAPRSLRFGDLVIPEPIPEKQVGWPTALIDTSKVTSFNQVDAGQASQVFAVIAEKGALVNLTVDGKVSIPRLALTNPTAPGAKSDGDGARYGVEIDVQNKTGSALDVTVPKGQVFENVKPRSGFQNIVAAETATVKLGPYETSTIHVPGFCLNKLEKAPVGQNGYITPLRLRVDFSNQADVWERARRLQKRP